MDGGDGHHDPSLGPIDPNGKGCGCMFLVMAYMFITLLLAEIPKPFSVILFLALTVFAIYLGIKVILS
jgi:hypothetical protein